MESAEEKVSSPLGNQVAHSNEMECCAYVLVSKPPGRKAEYYVDREAHNPFMVRASPDIRAAHVYHCEGTAQGMRVELMRSGFPGYETMRVVMANGKPVAPPAKGGCG